MTDGNDSGVGWQVDLTVPSTAVEIFVQALEPLSYATAAFVEDEATDLWRITAYTIGAPPVEQLDAAMATSAARAKIVEPPINLLPLCDSDWVAVSRASTRPISAGRYFVRPSHFDEPSPDGAVILTIDASTAFGSGDHGTTQGCLLALDQIARERVVSHSLDLGCGSGILSLAMAQTWRQPVIAVDNDPESVRVTNENALTNGIENLVDTYCASGIDAVIDALGPFDLIVANILLGPLVQMAGNIACHLTPDGIAVLSGILSYQEKELRPVLVEAGLRFVRRFELDGWHTLVLVKS